MENLILSAICFLGLVNHVSAQFSLSFNTGISHSASKITNVSTTPNILFFENDDIIEFENLSSRIDAGVSYQFKNNLSVGIHYGKALIDFSYSLIDLRVGFGSSSRSAGDFIPYFHTYLGKTFEFGRWELTPYLGVGYRWSTKRNYLDYEKKIWSTGFGSISSTDSDGVTIISVSESNTDYILPRFFAPIGLDFNYILFGRFSLLANFDYQYSFNSAFTRQEVMYQDLHMPESKGFGIIERKNIISLNVGLIYTFEDVELTPHKKKRKTLKKNQ